MYATMVNTITWILIAVAAVIVIYVIYVFNGLIRLKNRIENAWAQIDVQLKRRADLIPNLINTVKGYMKHERGVLTEVTKARTELMKASNIKEKGKANNMLTGALKSLFAVAESYPDLKASTNFKQLQDELVTTEDKVAYSRQYYNDEVRRFNTKTETFPSNMVAKIMGFKEKDYFEAQPSDRKAVKVEF